jgi:hypothetical protein
MCSRATLAAPQNFQKLGLLASMAQLNARALTWLRCCAPQVPLTAREPMRFFKPSFSSRVD